MSEPSPRRHWGIQSGLLSDTTPHKSPSPPPQTRRRTPRQPDRTTGPTSTPIVQSPPDESSPDTVEKIAPASADQQQTAETTPTGASPLRRVAFRLDPQLRDAVTERARHDELTHAAVLVEAINAQADAGQLTPARRTGPTGLLTYNSTPRRTNRVTVPFEVRLPSADVATIDQLVTDYGWTSRTDLFTAALERYFAT